MGGLERALRGLDRRVAAAVRGARARRGEPVESRTVQLRSTAGYKLVAQIHTIAGSDGRARPAVLLCPGIDDPGAVFSGHQAPVSAAEVARLGCVVMTFDPAGRGDSWGEEDYGGPEHHDDVRVCLDYLAARPDVDEDRIGVVAISYGITMAVGALASPELRAPAAWLLDWEGPSDREIITTGGTRLDPADGHSLDDDIYWQPREPVRHVSALPCPYIRLQAERDHAQPGELRHAQRMIGAAEQGTLPWFQLNDHPRGEAPARPVWLPSGQLATNRILLRKIRTLTREPGLVARHRAP